MKYILLALVILAIPNAYAGDRQNVCAKYRTKYGWSDGYKVQGNVMKGGELNTAIRSFDYNSFSTYVVIFWSEEEVSVIELEMPYLSAFGQDGEDQQGKKWNISTSSICL